MSERRIRGTVAQRLRDEFFEKGKAEHAPCWICGGAIDYDARPATSGDSHNLDHLHPVSTHPDLQNDPEGFRHAHDSCNKSRGNASPSLGLGDPVPKWW